MNKTIHLLLLLILPVFLLVVWNVHSLLKEQYLQQQYWQQAEHMSVYSHKLNNALSRYDYLPSILGRNDALFDMAFANPSGASKQLESIRAEAGADTIYIMSPNGTTVASSDWEKENTLVGKSFHTRPYFSDALADGRGSFFGIGTTRNIPGYYVSFRYPVRGRIQGVIVVKHTLSEIESDWGNGGELVFVSDDNGDIILTSNEAWRYRTLQPLSDNNSISQQLSSQPLTALNLHKEDRQQITIDGKSYIHTVTDPGVMNWKLHYLTPYKQVSSRLLSFWSKALIVFLLGIALLLLMRMTKARDALRILQGESSSLRDLNQSLEKEILERKQIEAELREVQANLRRTSKLAAMGQLSAGITHELSQPLSAMRTYLASLNNSSFQSNEPGTANCSERHQKTLQKLTSLVDRMMSITQQLRYFARSGDKETRRIDLRSTIKGALNITKPAIQEAGVELSIQKPDNAVEVMAGQVRIEQVLVNLIRNALDVMKDNQADQVKQLLIILTTNAGKAILMVDDTGSGLDVEDKEMLFEPFYTTKPSGIGMGLGLAISTNIVAELEGTLSAENRVGRGARFIVTLPLIDPMLNDE